MKADFVIVGVMKCGTTTLAHFCTHHPSIAIPEKEVHYFDYDRNYSKGDSWYEEELLNCRKDSTLIYGEKTPYSFYTYTAERIAKYRPDMKLVWIFRNPVDRAYSNYNHDLYNIDEWRSFESCLKKEESRDVLYQYLSKGRYIEQVDHYLKYFPVAQMKFLLLEDLLKNPDRELSEVFRFLGVPESKEAVSKQVHSKKSLQPRNPAILYFYKKFISGKGRVWNYLWRKNFSEHAKRKLNPATREMLLNYYKEWNTKLAVRTGLDLSSWNK
jgi:hypothetical protein